MREATIRLTINDADAGEWLMQAVELNTYPERTTRDLVQQITEQLNDTDGRAIVAIAVLGPDEVESPRVQLQFWNENRGWEARADFEAWLLATLSLMAEHDAEHGPISTDRNRAATKAYARARGFIR